MQANFFNFILIKYPYYLYNNFFINKFSCCRTMLLTWLTCGRTRLSRLFGACVPVAAFWPKLSPPNLKIHHSIYALYSFKIKKRINFYQLPHPTFLNGYNEVTLSKKNFLRREATYKSMPGKWVFNLHCCGAKRGCF